MRERRRNDRRYQGGEEMQANAVFRRSIFAHFRFDLKKLQEKIILNGDYDSMFYIFLIHNSHFRLSFFKFIFTEHNSAL